MKKLIFALLFVATALRGESLLITTRNAKYKPKETSVLLSPGKALVVDDAGNITMSKVPALATAKSRGVAKHIYVAKRTDGKSGIGTSEDPYDGSTWSKFDAIITAWRAVPNVHLHLGQGIFYTRAGIEIGADLWTISGTGWGTKLVLEPGISASARVNLSMIESPYNQNYATTVRDLSIDGNYPNLAAWNSKNKISGIFLYGSNCRVSNVLVENLYGNMSSGQESFTVCLVSPSINGVPQQTQGGIIENCVARNPHGDYVGGFGIAGWCGDPVTYGWAEGTISGCSVTGYTWNAYGMSRGVLIGNYAENCNYGFYAEQTDKLIVSNNIFKNISGYAVRFNINSYACRDVQITNNVFEQHKNNSAAISLYAGSNNASGIIIKGNTIVASDRGTGILKGLDFGGVSNLSVVDNTFGVNVGMNLNSPPNTYVNGNRYLDGSSIQRWPDLGNRIRTSITTGDGWYRLFQVGGLHNYGQGIVAPNNTGSALVSLSVENGSGGVQGLNIAVSGQMYGTDQAPVVISNQQWGTGYAVSAVRYAQDRKGVTYLDIKLSGIKKATLIVDWTGQIMQLPVTHNPVGNISTAVANTDGAGSIFPKLSVTGDIQSKSFHSTGNISGDGPQNRLHSQTLDDASNIVTRSLADARYPRLEESNTYKSQQIYYGETPLIFGGATADPYFSSFSFVDPTQNNTFTLPNKSGVVALTRDVDPVISAGRVRTVNLAASSNHTTSAHASYEMADGALKYSLSEAASASDCANGSLASSINGGSAHGKHIRFNRSFWIYAEICLDTMENYNCIGRLAVGQLPTGRNPTSAGFGIDIRRSVGEIFQVRPWTHDGAKLSQNTWSPSISVSETIKIWIHNRGDGNVDFYILNGENTDMPQSPTFTLAGASIAEVESACIGAGLAGTAPTSNSGSLSILALSIFNQ